MASELNDRNKLESWKEIATYLGRDTRTCQRWEEALGLPIHRLESSAKPRIFAYVDEIDKWVAQKSNGQTPDIVIKKHDWRKFRFHILTIALAFLIFVIFLGPKIFSRTDGPPNATDFRIIGSELLIFDQEQRLLQKYDTHLENLEKEGHYRIRSNSRRIVDEHYYYLPKIMVRDLDGDELNEVLFAICTGDISCENVLICLDHTGSELWKKELGKEVVFQEKMCSSDYRILGFDTHDINNDGAQEILVLLNHAKDPIGVFIVLDTRGQVIGEYWNAGHLRDFVFLDVDGDADEEIILAGMNRVYEKPCLVVLDGSHIQGFSPPCEEGFVFQTQMKNHELYYALLPAISDYMDGYRETPIDQIVILEESPGKRLHLINRIEYFLDYRLALSDVRFPIRVRAYLNSHLKDNSNLTSGSILRARMMETGLAFFDGQNWVPSCTESQRLP